MSFMYTALRATSLTLSETLKTGLIADGDLGRLFDPNGPGPGNMVVSLNSPQEMTELAVQGLSVWLYRAVRDPDRLNAPPERVLPSGLRWVPLPFRLHYLMTPIVGRVNADSPETEQLILGKVLQILHDRPTLLGADLRGEFAGTEVELTARLEPLSLEDLSRVYDALERSWQLSVSYEVSVVYIESAREPIDLTPVRVVLPEYRVFVGAAS